MAASRKASDALTLFGLLEFDMLNGDEGSQMKWYQAILFWACQQKSRRVRRVLRRAYQADQARASIYQTLAEREPDDSNWQSVLTMLAKKAAASAGQHEASLRRFGEEEVSFQEHRLFRARRWCLLHCGRARAVWWLEKEEGREKRMVLREMIDLRNSLRVITHR
jgi:hypothetical protein